VRETVVVARENLPSDRCLVAYVVPDSDTAPLPHELRDYLKERLLNTFCLCGARCLPLTPNGKVDRRALPTPILRVQNWQLLIKLLNLMSKKP